MRFPARIHLTLRRGAAIAVLGFVVATAAAFASGQLSYVVTNGVSMQPSYHAGDLVFVTPSGSYSVGDVVAYEAGASDPVQVLHRIIGGNASGFEIKGDNNQSIDPTKPRADQILGRAAVHIPYAGTVVSSPFTRVVALLAFVALMAVLIRQPAPKPGSAHGSRRASDGSTTLWKTFIALDVVLLAAAAIAFGATTRHAGPVHEATQTSALSYQARTPISDTYPTGEVVTGDPVFTKLVDAVDVSYRYSTNAPAATVRGTVQLDAELSTSTGWHTTVALVARSPLRDGRADLTAELDLVRVQRVADDVAAETGVGAGPINIKIIASTIIAVGDSEPAKGSAELGLQLTPLQLTYAGEKPNASAHGPAVVTTSPLGLATPTLPDRSSATTLKLPLLIALLLCCATTAVVWPSRVGESHAAVRTAVAGIQIADRLTRVRLTDRAALDDIASTTGAGIVQGDDGWQGVFTPDVVYWITDLQPEACIEPVRSAEPTPARCALVEDRRGDPLAAIAI